MKSLSDHWGKDDLYEKIISALVESGKSLETLSIDDLSPVDHFHARGYPATVELADQLPINSGDQLVDIGCGIGGPARYLANRFDCYVSGIDITESFIDVANKLTVLLGLEHKVKIELGDGNHLPYQDQTFNGAYAQHVTMNVADRTRFFSEAFRVLKPSGFFALSEHGLGPMKNPHHPLPWSADGGNEYLITPEETNRLLTETGFTDIQIENTGSKYLIAYQRAIELADQDKLPTLGVHILLGKSSPDITKNAARNIKENRTCPIQLICKRPA